MKLKLHCLCHLSMVLMLQMHDILDQCMEFKLSVCSSGVAWWCMVVSSVTPQQRVPGSNPGWGLSVWSLHVLPMYV